MEKVDMSTELVAMDATSGNEVIEVIEDTSKLGMFFKQVVAVFKPEKLNKDTALELMRVENTLQMPLSPTQVEGMRRRVAQIEHICSLMGADNKLFVLKVQQLKELIELKQKQWKLAIEASSAEKIAEVSTIRRTA